ncbi:MAG TPA: SDR family oxidoreductase [Bacteriovoracaceae bacterium]|nr:SDR family oxidoreductase [Bacteriovoracaceae bacterium]
MDFLGIKNKVYFIAGVANKKSVACFTARTLIDAGAKCIFSVARSEQLETVKKLFPDSPVFVCDVENLADLESLEETLRQFTSQLDGFVHSLAFANFSNGVRPFHQTGRADYLQAAQVSSFSLVEVTNQLKTLFAPDASIVTISISNTKATSYGYLGPIKAMLEATVPFLAKSLSEVSNVRVNAVGAGPLKTSASAGIPDYIDNYLFAEELTLRKKALETQEVANTVCFLLSPRSSGINATTLVVDAGMSCNYFDQKIVKGFVKGGPL